MSPGCTRFDVLAGRPITAVHASLWANDALWATAEGGEQTTLWGCTNQGVDAEIEVDAQGQPGLHAVESRAEARPAAELRSNPLAAARILSRLNAAAFVPAGTLDNLHELSLDAQHRATHTFTLAPNSCKTVVAALGFGASGITLQIVDTRSNTVLTTSHGAYVASAKACSERTPMQVQARLLTGVGKTSALIATIPR